MRYSKYGNQKVKRFGINFDSKAEAKRYSLLKCLESKGMISDLRLQVPFDIIPTVFHEGKTLRKIVYKADFVYEKNGETIVEDVKGYETPEFKIKMRLFILKYPEYKFKIVR